MDNSTRLERIRVIKSLIKNLEYQSFDMFNDIYSLTPREQVEQEIEQLKIELRTLQLNS